MPDTVQLNTMAYDEALASRIRSLIGEEPDVAEKKMFGGLAFLARGNMAIAASGEGGVLVRVDPARSEELLAGTGATVAVMRGRAMPGWLRVASDRVSTAADLEFWVRTGVAFARSLPEKS